MNDQEIITQILNNFKAIENNTSLQYNQELNNYSCHPTVLNQFDVSKSSDQAIEVVNHTSEKSEKQQTTQETKSLIVKERWTQLEDAKLLACKIVFQRGWGKTSKFFPQRSLCSLITRWRRCIKLQYKEFLSYKDSNPEKYNEMLNISREIIKSEDVLTKLIEDNNQSADNCDTQDCIDIDKDDEEIKKPPHKLEVNVSDDNEQLQSPSSQPENAKSNENITEGSKELSPNMTEEKAKVFELKSIISYFEKSLEKLKADLSFAEENLKKSEDAQNDWIYLSVKRQKTEEDKEDLKIKGNNTEKTSEVVIIKKCKSKKSKRTGTNHSKTSQGQKSSEGTSQGLKKSQKNAVVPPTLSALFMNEKDIINESKKAWNKDNWIDQLISTNSSKSSNYISNFLV